MEEAPDDLALAAEKAFYILVKAREYDAKEEQSDPESGSNPSDDKGIDILEQSGNDPIEAELSDALHGLNDDERFDLLAITWIGRGDYTGDEWAKARGAAGELRAQQVPEYLIHTPLLSDYIEEGLSQIAVSVDDFENQRL